MYDIWQMFVYAYLYSQDILMHTYGHKYVWTYHMPFHPEFSFIKDMSLKPNTLNG